MIASPSDVLIVAFSLDVSRDSLQALGALLDADEQTRARQFIHEKDKTRFVVAHAMTRFVLGRCLGVAPWSLQFSTGKHGKPTLIARAIDLRFNLSHAAAKGLLAVTRGRDVGIDIDAERPIELLEVARYCFSPREYAALQSVAKEDRLSAFCRGWTRKESFVKAIGSGLSFPLGEFDVSLEDSHENLLLTYRTPPGDQRSWTIRSLDVGVGFSAAITIEGTGWRLVRRDLQRIEAEYLLSDERLFE